jgi:hypothetical protein
MGEKQLSRFKSKKMFLSCSGVEAVSGRARVRWETASSATPMGQLAYFIEFLNLTGLWSGFVESCPLNYISPNAPGKTEVLGTWLLSMLAGHRRYAHVTAMRCDGVNPKLLGMKKVISEDALRNALKRIAEMEGCSWLDAHLSLSVAPLLDVPWILDADTTIKPVYGHQEGALLGYNPKKPGRPSHAYHTYLMAGLRQVVGVEVLAGDKHSATHAKPGLLKILDDLPEDRKPKLVRGDNAFGHDAMMEALESRGQPYLFKLRLTKNVKRYVARLFGQTLWHDAGQGWEGQDGELILAGWQQKRRVIVLRRPLKGEMLISGEQEGQQVLAFIEADRKAGQGITGYEYAVLITNTDYKVLSLGQLYRDRADAENAFDELKNQWGWGGFTTHDLDRCQLAARGVALAYNWWSLFVRLANPRSRREAITSRPLLMASVGRRTEHAGQTTITLTSTHTHFRKAQAALMRVSSLLQEWYKQTSEKFRNDKVWKCVCDYIKRSFYNIKPPLKRRPIKNYAFGIT